MKTADQKSKISVIIPVLNDAFQLRRTLKHLAPVADQVEVIVVDGGSLDCTAEVCAMFPRIKSISSPPGRSIQMNAGAESASGDILLFLHADTLLNGNWPDAVVSAAARPGFALGAFRIALDGTHPGFRLIELGVTVRSRLFRLPYGDQALFLKKQLFREIGGYPKIPIMEDVHLVSRARHHGKLVFLPFTAVTSTRRWERDGILKRTARNLCTFARHLRGVPPEALASRYNHEANALVVFCKFPEPGKVKTRLAAGVGKEQAADIYRTLAGKTLNEAGHARHDYDLLYFFDPPGSGIEVMNWIDREGKYIPQAQTDLGGRMLDAFRKSKKLGCTHTVIVGTDCPALKKRHIDKAFQALATHDVVIGPSMDGGYYLIGARSACPFLFKDIPWSTNKVMDISRHRIKEHNLSHLELEPLRDLDDPSDLEYYRHDIANADTR